MAENKKNVSKELEEAAVAQGVGIGELMEPVEQAEDPVAGEVIEGDAIVSGLVLHREIKKTKDGKREYSVFGVSGELRGQQYRAEMVPPDMGGYAVLNLVFGKVDDLPLLMVPYEMRDEVTKKKTSGFTYKVLSEEDGITFESKVKPSRNSDKEILRCLLQVAAKKAAQQ